MRFVGPFFCLQDPPETDKGCSNDDNGQKFAGPGSPEIARAGGAEQNQPAKHLTDLSHFYPSFLDL